MTILYLKVIKFVQNIHSNKKKKRYKRRHFILNVDKMLYYILLINYALHYAFDEYMQISTLNWEIVIHLFMYSEYQTLCVILF